MWKRLGLLVPVCLTLLLVAMIGATSVLADDGVVPVPVPEVAAAEEGLAAPAMNLVFLEAEGSASAATGMTTRADTGNFYGVNRVGSFRQGFQHSLWSALGQLNSPFIVVAAALLALTITTVTVASWQEKRARSTTAQGTSVAPGRMRTVPHPC